ncbi:MAG: cyclase family protein [Candidatus Thermoplasmatota archaeon]|jgi:arylformamidase|nr:cyclase family protein [Candidatus Thermoplasmatota archaeon]MCL5667897.1 cyclase family protein [Candidatus Thermoplasmatota archaeon]
MIDLSLPLKRGLITYPGDAQYEEYEYYTHKKDHVHIMRVIMETHSGTHFDAPFHMLPDGRKANEVDLRKFLGKATVIEVKGDSIEPSDIPDNPTEIILFKTKNSGLYDAFHEDFTYISEEAAKKIATKNVNLVGIDYLSIEKFGIPDPVSHKTLMRKDIVIVEGLLLSNVQPGTYDFVCLPLNMGEDGAPCRAILL